MSKNMKTDAMEFDFGAGYGWDDVTDEQAGELMRHLPLNIEELKIDNYSHGTLLIDGITKWIEKSQNLKALKFWNTTVGSSEAGARMAKALPQDNIVDLYLCYTDIVQSTNAEEWGETLGKMKSLKNLSIYGKGGGGQEYNPMPLDGGIQIFEGVANSVSLQRIDMGYNGYGKEVIAALGNALNKNHTITKVSIEELESEMKDDVKAAVEKLNEDMKDRTPKVDIGYCSCKY
mmetsp:Transcript_8181/g.9552  ORF Transcript_8181/g.9552 Transcript_8181/m.9552 type:complete len:232 (+) Transcript_8181:1-696(+)